MIRNQLAKCLLLNLFLFSALCNGQDLSLHFFPEKVNLTFLEDLVVDVELANRGKKEVNIYGLFDTWHRIPLSLFENLYPLEEQDYLKALDTLLAPNTESLGLILVLFDSAGGRVGWRDITMHKVGEVKAFHEKSRSEKLAFLDSLDQLIIKEKESKKEQLRKSRTQLRPGGRTRITVSIDLLSNFAVKRGSSYSLYIYYVVNEKIFNILPADADPWLGCIRSNKVEIIYR